MKDQNKKITVWVVATAVIVLALYDVYAESRNNNDTISVVLNKKAKKNPIIAFAIGLLSGHWFWPL